MIVLALRPFIFICLFFCVLMLMGFGFFWGNLGRMMAAGVPHAAAERVRGVVGAICCTLFLSSSFMLYFIMCIHHSYVLHHVFPPSCCTSSCVLPICSVSNPHMYTLFTDIICILFFHLLFYGALFSRLGAIHVLCKAPVVTFS